MNGQKTASRSPTTRFGRAPEADSSTVELDVTQQQAQRSRIFLPSDNFACGGIDLVSQHPAILSK